MYIIIYCLFFCILYFHVRRPHWLLKQFWNIPKSGGTVINDILAGCFHIVCANEVGGQFGHAEDDALQVFEKHGAKYVNVDLSSLKGIAKAKNLNLANSGMVDAIIAWFVYETSELFSPEHRGKFFTVMRHPIERAALLISNLQNNKKATTYDPSFASMTIEDFVQAGRVDNNWYVMSLWLRIVIMHHFNYRPNETNAPLFIQILG